MLYLYAAVVGGYCNEPNECICADGYAGAHCQIGKPHEPKNECTLDTVHMRFSR